VELRPLRFGETLDAAFRIYRRRWLACFTRSMIVMIPTWLVISLLALTLNQAEGDRGGEVFALSLGIPISVVTSLMMALYLNAVAWTTVWCTGRLTCAFLDLPPSEDRAQLRSAPFRALNSGVLGVILGVTTAGVPLMSLLAVKIFNDNRAPLFVLIPVLWIAMLALYAFTSLALPAMTVERIGVVPALTRSFHLTTRRYGGTLLMVLSVYLIIVITTPGTSLFSFLIGERTDAAFDFAWVLSFLTIWCMWGAFIIPFVPALFIVWYFVVRIRTEGLDLAAAATTVGAARKRATTP
jgi:hypothetical protein